MNLLLLSTLTVGVLHALAPDHWLPFVSLAKAQNWTRRRLTVVTTLAGFGHVAASLLIAAAGIWIGTTLDNVNLWESRRGDIASLLLIGFGLAYAVWGLKNWGRRHTHNSNRAKLVTSWTLFALIIFGPCEPLIPLIIAGYAQGWDMVLLVFGMFGGATILMMLVQVHSAMYGLSLIRSHAFEHASHVIAGGVIALTGIAIRFLGI